MTYSPLGRGLLTSTLTSEAIDGSDFRRHDPRFHGPDLDRNLGHVAVLRDLAAGLGLTPGQLALAWLLAQGADVVPIPGSRRPGGSPRMPPRRGARLSADDLERLAQALHPAPPGPGTRHSFAAPVSGQGRQLAGPLAAAAARGTVRLDPAGRGDGGGGCLAADFYGRDGHRSKSVT